MTIEKSKHLLVLDLDETLIHATETALEIEFDFKFDHYFVYKRPHLDQFLIDISQHFKLGIWSSADDPYVEEIVKLIKPLKLDFEFVWAKSRCTLQRDYYADSYYYEKRLDKLKKKGFRLENIILVDDSPEKSRNNYGNAVYIKEFIGKPQDIELQFLFEYLLKLKSVDNIRSMEKRGWRNR